MKFLILLMTLATISMSAQDALKPKEHVLLGPPDIQIRSEGGYAPEGILSGTVFDDKHRPVEGLFIYAHVHQKGSPNLTRMTSVKIDGAFTLLLPEGNYQFNKLCGKKGVCNNQDKCDGCIWLCSSSNQCCDVDIFSYGFSIGYKQLHSYAKVEIFIQPKIEYQM